MEYISSEEFIKQDNEVHEILLRWINENITDYDLIKNGDSVMLYKDYLVRGADEIDLNSYPLFTEGQLKKFIEDKTHKITIIEFDYDHYNIVQKLGKAYITDQKELLKAYWEVALEIAKGD